MMLGVLSDDKKYLEFELIAQTEIQSNFINFSVLLKKIIICWLINK